MYKLSFDGITKKFGGAVAVNNVSLNIRRGEFVSLLGASGCGKTTLLRIIAGFARADSGTISIDGQRIDHLPPGKRGIGFVFQSYALFPTQTVAENIGFALDLRRDSRADIAKRVTELCEIVQLQGKEDRYPHELSGGQQQRVALARALAPKPEIMLMDEPLSALDAKIRARLRAEIRSVTDLLGITTVYVTHDQEEALAMSDRVAVMEGGVIRQVGTPMEIYHGPADNFVAGFIGDSNVLPAMLAGKGKAVLQGCGRAIDVVGSLEQPGACIVSVRPEHIEFRPADGVSDSFIGTIRDVSFKGQLIRARIVTAQRNTLIADVWSTDWQNSGLAAGDSVTWSIAPGKALVFASESAL